jgi:putative Holliday junction resolvase
VIETLPSTGRVLGIDPGAARHGIAVSDSARTLAFPRDAVAADDTAPRHLAALVEEEGAVVVVIGLPLGLDGREGAAAKAARQLGDALVGALAASVAVTFHDERLTTVEASRSLRAAGQGSRAQRASIDSAAATVLLESWMQQR